MEGYLGVQGDGEGEWEWEGQKGSEKKKEDGRKEGAMKVRKVKKEQKGGRRFM